jgi:MFS family permease
MDYTLAHGAGLLFAARALQGLAVGLVTGAAAAALHDLRPQGGAAPLLSSLAPTGGQALGAIAARVPAQYAPAPARLIWWLLLGAFVASGSRAARAPGAAHDGSLPNPGGSRPHGRGQLRPTLTTTLPGERVAR